MKPLKLKVTAFGAYNQEEVIDFSELKNHRLFVISGDTGAGKTTLFDAICFALYGSASGEDRSDVKILRSDFAEAEVHTSVELIFELHDQKYRILRQLAHVKQGNKGATGDKYEFYKIVEKGEIPCVERQIVSEINKKVEELVGLTKDQFSQIVMLPQGEFRKLLTSQTENKEEILRRIFKTEKYQQISDRLREKKKAAEEVYKQEAVTRDRYINDIDSILPSRESTIFKVLSQENLNTNQVVAGLEKEVNYYQSEIEKNEKNAKDSDSAYNKKLGEFHQAKALNERFSELDDKKEKLNGMVARVTNYKEKEKQLENAERASNIESYDIQLKEWKKDEQTKKKALVEAQEVQKTNKENLKMAQTAYQTEANKKDDREEITRQLDRCKEFLPTVQKMEEKKTTLIQLKKNLDHSTKSLEHARKLLDEKKAKKESVSNDIKKLEKQVDLLPDKEKKLMEMENQARIIQSYLKSLETYLTLSKELEEKEGVYLTQKEIYEKHEQDWINGQASILAAHLHDGEPCPVCGSKEHTDKAKGQDKVPSKEELESVKKEFNTRDQEYRETTARLKAKKEELDEKANEVTTYSIDVTNIQHSFDDLVQDRKELRKEVNLLTEDKEKLTKHKLDLEKIEKELEELAEQKEKLEKEYQDNKSAFETNNAVYKQQINQVPEEVRDLEKLKNKILKAETLKGKLEKTWESAQNQLQLAKDEETKATTNLTNANKQLDECKGRKEKAEKQFLDALKNANFSSEDDYRKAKMQESERRILRKDIESFNQKLAALKQQVTDLKEALKDKEKVDIALLEAVVHELKKASEAAKEQLTQSKQYLSKTEDLMEKILESEKKVSHLEKQLNMINDLHDVVRGQNSSKISFERYLQIEFLEQIIVAANERLKRLSNGQFSLIRSERQESRGKQSGLGLDVFDVYTGLTRDVKSLSGGEKFNASLCLALGMADVIQSFQGGVSIDTMFIDEGFGSLDEESLTKAIDTLIELQQSGRMVGIISHVKELKSAIPAILEVKKTIEGHSRTKFVVN